LDERGAMVRCATGTEIDLYAFAHLPWDLES
jgi:hypothetical protein